MNATAAKSLTAIGAALLLLVGPLAWPAEALPALPVATGDGAPPVIDSLTLPSSISSGDALTIRATASDSSSGVDTIWYTVDGGPRMRLTPTEGTLPALTATAQGTYQPATQVAVGHSHSCAIVRDGTIQCWGSNWYGQLGIGPSDWTPFPVTVLGIRNARQVATGADWSCALLADATVKCWGRNHWYQAGPGPDPQVTPTTIPDLTGATAITAGMATGCALTGSGHVSCWGSPIGGATGDGSITNAVAISLGDFHGCALLSDRSVKCWGTNDNGQLGNGTTATTTSPVAVSGITKATGIEAGGFTSCATLSNGSFRCWGSNQWDGGVNLSRLTPVQMPGITSARIPFVGSSSSCVILADTTVRCFGINNNGELGDGSGLEYPVGPVTPVGVSGAVRASSGSHGACTVPSDGGVRCWGPNTGSGTWAHGYVPVAATGFGPLGVGSHQVCVIATDVSGNDSSARCASVSVTDLRQRKR